MPPVYMCTLLFVLFALDLRVSADSSAATAVSLTGVGSTIPITLYQSAMFSYRFVDPTVQTAFYGCTNDQALCRLTNASRECAATDNAAVPAAVDWVSLATLPSADLYQRYPDLQLYPTVASAVVPIYNLNGVTDLVLSIAILAKIWSGRITTWDHPDIRAANRNFSAWNIPANQSITLVARADSAGTTQVFKKAMAGVDAAFKAQVGTASAASWAGVQVVLASGSQLVTSAVMRSHYSLSYIPMGFALANRVPVAKLNRTGVVVEPSTASVQYALLERGLAFGNNGDDPAHLTGDLINAVNPLAWPITSYSYVGIRKSTVRPGATCATATALVNFWMWFWNSNDAASLAASLGFSILPAVVRDYVVARFSQGVTCNGQVVWQAPPVQAVVGYGPESAAPIFAKFQQAYALGDSPKVLNYSTLPNGDLDAAPLLRAGAFVVSTTPLSPSTDAVSFVLACEALVAVSQYALTLDGLTLAKILNGDIQTWLHPDIVALNPSGLQDSGGRALNDTAQRIVLLQGPTAGSAALTALLRRYHPPYNGTAIRAAETFTDEVQLQSSVLGTPYSFSVTALAGSLPVELQFVAMVPDGGGTPVRATAQSCSSFAVFDSSTRGLSYNNHNSNGSCYPLLLTVYVSMHRQCSGTGALNANGVAFMEWLFSGVALDAALDALGLGSFTASEAVQVINGQAMFQLSCQVRPTAPMATSTSLVPLLLGIIIPVALVLLVGSGGCGWWLWRITEYHRMMRKKFSNDNVAESCAEAIARFDLAAVAWLQEVKEPNKIQLAFLAIIALLTEVKPFIPDQLMVRLTASKANPQDDEEESDADRRSELSTPRALIANPRSRVGSLKQPAQLPHPRRGTRRSIGSSDSSRQLAALRDWQRKRCTFLCVRFGSAAPTAERRLPALVQAAGRIVDVAKVHGATIDAVGVDFVTVHWGVTSSPGDSATRAVHVGLEMAKLRGTLPEDQRAAFWVQVGVGRGLCDCGTVSTESGHRYFVVWGPEASLAMEVAMANLPKQVRATLLVTPAVFQEVQFTVQCAPRLWTRGDTLLWEPLCDLKKDEDDEWMYELKKMNEGATQCNRALLAVFLMARSEASSAADLAASVAELRVLHGDQLSEGDVAALDLLVSMHTVRPQQKWELVVDDVYSDA